MSPCSPYLIDPGDSVGADGRWTIPRLWEGERAFIIAGGGSVVGSRVSRIPSGKGNRILCVKHAAELRPDADALFWGGQPCGLPHPRKLLKTSPIPLKVTRECGPDVPEGVFQVTRERRKGKSFPGLSLDPSTIGGLCSGGSALNLAFHLGVKEIVLVGYDFIGRHWRKIHPMPFAPMTVHEKHAKAIDSMARDLKDHGVTVINTSRKSRLMNYTRKPLNDLLQSI